VLELRSAGGDRRAAALDLRLGVLGQAAAVLLAVGSSPLQVLLDAPQLGVDVRPDVERSVVGHSSWKRSSRPVASAAGWLKENCDGVRRSTLASPSNGTWTATWRPGTSAGRDGSGIARDCHS